MMTKIQECEDVFLLKQVVECLYDILDDIDTASDRTKDDLESYAFIVRALHIKRFSIATSDGYGLFLVNSCAARTPEVCK